MRLKSLCSNAEVFYLIDNELAVYIYVTRFYTWSDILFFFPLCFYSSQDVGRVRWAWRESTLKLY